MVEGWARWRRLNSLEMEGTLVPDSVQPHGQPSPHEKTTVGFSLKIATPPRPGMGPARRVESSRKKKIPARLDFEDSIYVN